MSIKYEINVITHYASNLFVSLIRKWRKSHNDQKLEYNKSLSYYWKLKFNLMKPLVLFHLSVFS